jgi:hypothetical protein
MMNGGVKPPFACLPGEAYSADWSGVLSGEAFGED